MPNPIDAGRTVGALVLLAIIAVFVYVPSAIEVTATDVSDDAGIWLYDSDVVAGTSFEGLARVDSDARIVAVHVNAGERRTFDGDGDNDLDFEIEIPVLARGEAVVSIDVDYAYRDGALRRAVFWRGVTVHSRVESDLRRAVKASLAAASWLVLLVLDTIRRRRYQRQYRAPGRAWLIAMVPVAVVGWCWFSELLVHVMRFHGWWFASLCMAAWFSALLIAKRRCRTYGMKSYLVEQILVDSFVDDAPFRGANVRAPILPIGDLELAWLAAGFGIERVGPNLRVELDGRGVMMVVVPPCESIGGEPFEIHVSGYAIASVALSAACPLLGELRVFGSDERFRVSSR